MDGLLAVWKEKGMTSHDVVQKIRKIIGTKKVGHTGTLDPDVAGVLPVCINQGTKLVEDLMGGQKVYQGEISLGLSTTTEDASGDQVDQVDLSEGDLTEEDVDQAMEAFVGVIQQTPPMYSAVRVKGKRLYEYARAGQIVDRPSRSVEIFAFERTGPLRFEDGLCRFDFEVSCSKGTYVRTLSVDLGLALDLPAHMSELTRLESAGVSAEDCLTLAEIEDSAAKGDLADHVIPIHEILKDMEAVEIDEDHLNDVKYGRLFPKDAFGAGRDFPILLLYEGQAVAVYDVFQKNPTLIKPHKMFVTTHD